MRQVLMSYFVCFLFDVFEFRRVKNEDVGDSARDLTFTTSCILKFTLRAKLRFVYKYPVRLTGRAENLG